MPQNALIQVRVDQEMKKSADKLFKDLGMDTGTAIRIFLKQSLLRKTIPFTLITDPFYSESNMRAIREALERLDKGLGTERELIEVNDEEDLG